MFTVDVKQQCNNNNKINKMKIDEFPNSVDPDDELIINTELNDWRKITCLRKS